MKVTTGKGGDGGAEARVLLDVWDQGDCGGMQQFFSVDDPVPYRLARVGGVATDRRSGNLSTLWTFDGGQAVRLPLADQFTSATRSRSRMNGRGWVGMLAWQFGFDPADYPGLGSAVPLWRKYILETTIRRIGSAGALTFGWENYGGTLGTPYNPASLNGLGFAMVCPTGTTDWSGITYRVDPTGAGVVGTIPFVNGPVSANVFRRLRAEVTTGPVWSAEWFIDDALVASIGLSSLPILNLNTVSNMSDLTFRGSIQTSASFCDGPYSSRARILAV